MSLSFKLSTYYRDITTMRYINLLFTYLWGKYTYNNETY